MTIQTDFERTLRVFSVNGATYRYVSLPVAAASQTLRGIMQRPVVLRVLAENLLRHAVTDRDAAMLAALAGGERGIEIPFRPARVLLGAYLFGGVTMLQFHLQGEGVHIPSQFLSMLPYLATIVVLGSGLYLWLRKPQGARKGAPGGAAADASPDPDDAPNPETAAA